MFPLFEVSMRSAGFWDQFYSFFIWWLYFTFCRKPSHIWANPATDKEYYGVGIGSVVENIFLNKTLTAAEPRNKSNSIKDQKRKAPLFILYFLEILFSSTHLWGTAVVPKMTLRARRNKAKNHGLPFVYGWNQSIHLFRFYIGSSHTIGNFFHRILIVCYNLLF